MSPTYHVYLYNPSKNNFFNSRELTELLSDSYDDFDIDRENQKHLLLLVKTDTRGVRKAYGRLKKNKPVLVK